MYDEISICKYMTHIPVYTTIYYYIQAYAISFVYISIYPCMSEYIQFSKHVEKLCISAEFEPVISCILPAVFTTTLRASTRRFYILL